LEIIRSRLIVHPVDLPFVLTLPKLGLDFWEQIQMAWGQLVAFTIALKIISF
jgi:hypothetical protein